MRCLSTTISSASCSRRDSSSSLSSTSKSSCKAATAPQDPYWRGAAGWRRRRVVGAPDTLARRARDGHITTGRRTSLARSRQRVEPQIAQQVLMARILVILSRMTGKKQVAVGVKSTREERRAVEGVSLADLGESVSRAASREQNLIGCARARWKVTRGMFSRACPAMRLRAPDRGISRSLSSGLYKDETKNGL